VFAECRGDLGAQIASKRFGLLFSIGEGALRDQGIGDSRSTEGTVALATEVKDSEVTQAGWVRVHRAS
jgi:hypothetical protein